MSDDERLAGWSLRARASETRWLAEAAGSGPLRRTCALQTPREEKKTEESGASSAEHVEREQQATWQSQVSAGWSQISSGEGSSTKRGSIFIQNHILDVKIKEPVKRWRAPGCWRAAALLALLPALGSVHAALGGGPSCTPGSGRARGAPQLCWALDRLAAAEHRHSLGKKKV